MKVQKFRKKPVVIEAIHLNKCSFHDSLRFIGDKAKNSYAGKLGGDLCWIEIATLEGTMTATENNWIIKGIKGEFYPVKDDIFHETYEKT